MHSAAVEVVLLAQRLHDELLQVLGEQGQAVLVGDDDHVLGPAAVCGVIPHQGQQGGRVARRVAIPRSDVGVAGPVQDGVQVESLQRRRQQAAGRSH